MVHLKKFKKKYKKTIIRKKRIIATIKRKFRKPEDLIKDLTKDNYIKDKVKNYDYIIFTDKNCKNLKYRMYLQVYSLEKTKKQISCCDYYVYTKHLGNYLHFNVENSFKNLDRKNFSSFLNMAQLMINKKYFLENIEKFQKNSDKILESISEKNTAFVSFPLVKIRKIKITDYQTMKKAFIFRFPHQLYSLKYRGKIFTSIYIPAFFMEGIKGKIFMLKEILEILKDKSRKNQLRVYESNKI